MLWNTFTLNVHCKPQERPERGKEDTMYTQKERVLVRMLFETEARVACMPTRSDKPQLYHYEFNDGSL